MALAMHMPTVAPTFVAALAHENISCPITCQSVRLTTCVVLFGAEQNDVRGGFMGFKTRRSEAQRGKHGAKKSKQVHGEPSSTSPSDDAVRMDVDHGASLSVTR